MEKEVEVEVDVFCPLVPSQLAAVAGAGWIRSQDHLLGFSRGCRGLKA